MRKFLSIVTIIGSLLGMLILFFGVMTANGAPQECASAAIAIGFAVLPYCLLRAAVTYNEKPTESEKEKPINSEKEKPYIDSPSIWK